MRVSLRSQSAAFVLAATLLWTPSAGALGFEIVYDPTNYAQNVMTAAHTLEQIHNQIQQLEQATRMLTKNPLQLSPELANSITQTRKLFAEAQDIAFDLQKVGQDFRNLYPDQYSDMNLGDMLAQSKRWIEADRRSVKSAMEAQARAAEAIAASQGQIDRALLSSSAAEGQTGAVQAGNQLLGVTAAQLIQIHTLLIAQGRALETERMERIASMQRADEIQRRAFPTTSNVALAPAKSAF